MTIESGPPLRLAPNPANPTRSIASEFGGTAPYRLSNYLRGGGLVPDTPENAGIPTTLPVRFSDFYGSSQAFVFTITLTGLVADYSYDMRAEAVLAGWDETTSIEANVTIAGAQGGDRNAAAAFIAIGSYPVGSVLDLTINAAQSISGHGGNGGKGAGDTGSFELGDIGGTALLTRLPTNITNNSVIGAGGTGGEGGISLGAPAGGGGGGGGLELSLGGVGGVFGSRNGEDGTAGTATTGGIGGEPGPFPGSALPGEDGFDLGQGPTTARTGIAIDGISHVTFITQGTILGGQIN